MLCISDCSCGCLCVVAQPNSAARPVQVMFLCGADVLESFAIPGIWRPEHVIFIFIFHFTFEYIKFLILIIHPPLSNLHLNMPV